MRDDIKKLIQENHVCVMATAAKDDPHCSLMSYAADDDCREIYMATHRDTKKYRNLKANPSVSLLIDTRQAGGKEAKSRTKALTVSGIYQQHSDDKRRKVGRDALLKRHPDLKDFLINPAAEVIVIRVTALQLLDGIMDAYFEKV